MERISVVLSVLLCYVLVVNSSERVNSTRKNLQPTVVTETVVDTIAIDDVTAFCESVVTMRGYSKRIGDVKETFMLTNNSNLHLSQVELQLRYRDVEGVLLHERTELIPCDLPPYSSRQLSIKTFDEGRKFHYIRNKSGKGAVAYEIEMRLISYSIKIERK